MATQRYQLEHNPDVLGIIAAAHPEIHQHFQEAITNNIPYRGTRAHIATASQSRWETLHIYPLHNCDGAVIRIDDLSEQVQLEGELLQSRKLETVGHLASGIAHDFNNILQIISSTAYLLGPTANDDPKLNKLIGHIMDASARGSELTAKLLSFSRQQVADLGNVDINALLQEIAALCQHTFDRLITIELDLCTVQCITKADSGELHSAFVNLAVNARDAMPDGGTLTLHSHIVQNEHGAQVLIQVSDSGSGIPQQIIDNIFDPFFTTKPVGKGTGLGLASSLRAIKNAEGHLDVQSEEGVGTTFTITLPLINNASDQEQQERKTDNQDSQANKGCILVVEDEEVIRMTCQQQLSAAGYEVHVCADGLEALSWYKQHFQEVDLVLMDMVMPHMSGADCLQEMAHINQSLRAVVTSGFIPEQELERIPQGLVCGRVPKPSSPAVLLRVIANALI